MYTWMRSVMELLTGGASDRHDEASAAFPAPAPAPQLLSDQQFREHARRLASGHPPIAASADDDLAALLDEHEAVLQGTFAEARQAIAEGRAIEPAVEWLIDNFYLVKEQIQEVRAGLPRPYRRELPVVAREGRNVPRILMLARELVAHADGRIQLRGVQDFVDAYQGQARLTLGELWAIPLMLRFALVEQLRPIADGISQRLRDRAAAARWSDRLHETAREHPTDLVHALAEMARSRLALTPAWIAEFQRRLQGGSQSLALALTWLDHQLGAQQLSLSDALNADTHAQATAQVSFGNCIGSLRLVGRTSWAEIVESLSVVEAMLRTDPAGVYGAMDFATRDRYRHAVEELARRSGNTEWDAAARALEHAASAPHDADRRREHVGYWLVGAGRAQLERNLRVRNPLTESATRAVLRAPNLFYNGAIGTLTALVALAAAPALERVSIVHAVVLLVALTIAASHLGVAVVNWLVTRTLPPHPLPRLALDAGVPDELRTLVAIPCLLTSDAEVSALVAGLEIRYLANRDDNIYFALLADYVDADAEHLPHDGERLALARAGIEALNREHEPGAVPRFCLFVRERRWNPASRRWMGEERKRGKLAALNRFLRGKAPADFSMPVGDADALRGVKYVITLDADTELPP
ncbi:MAG TPA: cyclic beta 1-2 glucan synthetase, partial [Rudaea sp.]